MAETREGWNPPERGYLMECGAASEGIAGGIVLQFTTGLLIAKLLIRKNDVIIKNALWNIDLQNAGGIRLWQPFKMCMSKIFAGGADHETRRLYFR